MEAIRSGTHGPTFVSEVSRYITSAYVHFKKHSEQFQDCAPESSFVPGISYYLFHEMVLNNLMYLAMQINSPFKMVMKSVLFSIECCALRGIFLN